jgi:hypothetical protein
MNFPNKIESKRHDDENYEQNGMENDLLRRSQDT